jgi:hypothetical protein
MTKMTRQCVFSKKCVFIEKKMPKHSKPAMTVLYLRSVFQKKKYLRLRPARKLTSGKKGLYFGKKGLLLREEEPFTSERQKEPLGLAIKTQR